MDKNYLAKNGFILKKKFFTKVEIKQLLKIQAGLHNKKNIKFGPLHKSRTTWNIIVNEKIINFVKNVLENKKISYLFHGHSVMQDKYAYVDSAWHRDNACRKFNKGPDWGPNYNVLRVAIYLDDSDAGLNLIKGSHTGKGYLCFLINTLRNNFKFIYFNKIFRFLFDNIFGNKIITKKGDCIFFFANTYHSAINSKNIKYTRRAIFLTYGTHNHHADNHLNYYFLHRKDLNYNLKKNIQRDFYKLLKKKNLFMTPPKKKVDIKFASL